MSDRTDYWSQHLAAIEHEGITTKAYAEREGLSVGALYQWQRELKARALAPRSASGSFVAVLVAPLDRPARCRLRLGDGLQLELSELPSPHWKQSASGGGRCTLFMIDE